MRIIITGVFSLIFCGIFSQTVIPLYPHTVPNLKPNIQNSEIKENGMFKNVIYPTLEHIKPIDSLSVGTAVIIIPGGSYGVNVYDGEGISIAKSLALMGVTSFILKYRLPNENSMIDKKIAPLQDAQQAIKVIREKAIDFNIDPNKIGVMGFSAGGHLASTLATHYKDVFIENANNTNLRPDFQILIYPVISMADSLTHFGSRDNLLGKNPSQKDILEFSNELKIDSNTPKAWITQATDDKLVSVDNSIRYFDNLRKNGVSVALHIFDKGDHGFIFRNKNWIAPLFVWMKDHKYLKSNID
jgi:acetyl esterase/lipase